MKKDKKIITSPGHQFEENVAITFNEIFEAIDILDNEHKHVMVANSILVNGMKAIKNILLSQSLMTEEQFEKEFNNVATSAKVQHKNILMSQSLDREKMFYDYIIEHVNPAHS